MHFSHQQLLKLVQAERQTTAQILMHLKIINEQKIFVKMNYKSLVDYCIKALKYSESAAYRRVHALRLERKIWCTGKNCQRRLELKQGQQT